MQRIILPILLAAALCLATASPPVVVSPPEDLAAPSLRGSAAPPLRPSLKDQIKMRSQMNSALKELNITESELLSLSQSGSSLIATSANATLRTHAAAGSTQKFTVVVITHNVHSEKTEGILKAAAQYWHPTKLLKDGKKADFVFVTHQETIWEGDAIMDAGMAALGYTKIESAKMNAHIRGHYTTISGLYYNNDSVNLQGKRLTVRTALTHGNRIIVDKGYGKVVERILIRVSEEATGTVYGDLQFMGAHMIAHEGNFWKRYEMYKNAWTYAKAWAGATNLPTPTFMAGDMNWRMAYGEWSDAYAPQTMDHVNCAANHYLEEFKCWAQGHGQRNDFSLAIEEAPLKFQPTYKRDKNLATNCVNANMAQPGDLDGDANWAATLRARQNTYPAKQTECYSDNKAKTASWTDRVVMYPFGGAGITTRYYTDFYKTLHEKSDHRMVVWAGDVSFPKKDAGAADCGENVAWATVYCEHAWFKTNICNGVYGTAWRDTYCKKTCCSK